MSRRLIATLGALALLCGGAALLIAQSGSFRQFLPLIASSAPEPAPPPPTPGSTPTPGASPTPGPTPTPGASPTPGPTPAPGAPLPLLPPDAASARLQAPDGFAVRLFATGLQGPRLMAVGPDGQLYVAERGAGRVIRLPDRDNDGLANGVEVVAAGLSGVHSLAWRGADLYAAMNDRVMRLRDGNGDGDAADPGEQTVNGNVYRVVYVGG